MPKIIQDQSKCIGCLACVGLHPDLFAVDDATGLAKLQKSESNGTIYTRQVDENIDVSLLPSACCGGAISIED